MKVLSSSRFLCAKTLCVLVLLVYCTFVCDGVCPKKALIPIETRLSLANAVYHGVVLNISKELHTMDMALVSIYKGGTTFASISPYVGSPYNTTDRQITLKVPLDIADCYDWDIKPMKELIIFSNVTYKPTSMPTSVVREGWLTANTQPLPWNPTLDHAMWKINGWSDWDEWTPCTKTCGGGNQLRVRFCRKLSFPVCEGFSEQRRTCNTFSCEGTINPLAPDFRKNFHPTRAQWDSIPERPHAFSLNPNSYIWISSSELFVPGKSFPKEFTIFLSLRLRTKSAGYGQGTLFALRSRRKTDSYLSLELIGYGAARLVHTGEGETKSIPLAVPLFDFRWHSIAVSVHDDNTVRAYVDCKWLRTDVLQKNALVTPRDADIIIGYLYSGDLEQLSIVPRAGEANHQCSTQITEIPYI